MGNGRDCGTGSPGNSFPIEKLRLGNETYTFLKRARIATVGDILETERGKGLRRVRSIGTKNYRDIQNALGEIGVTLDGDPSAPLREEPGPPARRRKHPCG